MRWGRTKRGTSFSLGFKGTLSSSFYITMRGGGIKLAGFKLCRGSFAFLLFISRFFRSHAVVCPHVRRKLIEEKSRKRRVELSWKLVKHFHPRVRKASKPAGNFRLMRYLYRIVSRSKIRYFYQPFRTFIRISRGRNRNAAVKIFNLSRNWTVQRLYPSRKLATPSRIGGPIWHLLDNTTLEDPKDNKRNLTWSVVVSYVLCSSYFVSHE